VFNLRDILTLFRSRPLSRYETALRDLAHGKSERALAALDELLGAGGIPLERARLQNKRGVALVALERREEARAAFSAALGERPSFAPAIVNLGNLELESGNLQQAVDLYAKAIAADPDSAAAFYHLGVAYKTMGRRPDAFEAFARARRLEGRRRPATSRDRWT
jgi:tetratricopeptide (TPR) repeat protein